MQVHEHLARQAPANLLSQELWAASADAAQWWQTHRTFTASLAMSSMAGYLLGVGDRHLNNILLLHASGDVVHVDMSVCFDQGHTLRVPEVVPFRLTQLMTHALGPMGCAGPFSSHAQV
jgi:phosphatidylinositol kinase/protein kinase (PI-3  family)